jgi:hypothetical protein
MMNKSHCGAFSLVLLLLISCPPSYAKKMYRWIDENGRVYFSDQVPPDQVQHQRETLNEKTRVLNRVEKAKTADELTLQKRLEALRKEQAKIIAKQASNDKVLMATYRSAEDIKRAMDNKLTLMNGEKKVMEVNKQRLEQQLQQQQQQAANHERNAQKIPEKLLKDIASTRQQIDFADQELDRHAQKTQIVEQAFNADIARFAFLNQAAGDGKSQQTSQNAFNDSDLGLFICQDSEQCAKAWKIAGDFVYQYATTGRDVETDRLIMSAPPVEDEDLSLSVSKLNEANIQQIFLDIRCKASTIGQELCSSERARTIRQGFSTFIQLKLTSQ